jgi:hypothetical protein
MVKDARAVANRIRSAAQSLTNPDDVNLVREYLTELELIPAEQEAEDTRPRVGASH